MKVDSRNIHSWTYTGGKNGESVMWLWGKSFLISFCLVLLFFVTEDIKNIDHTTFNISLFLFAISIMTCKFGIFFSIKRDYHIYKNDMVCREFNYGKLLLYCLFRLTIPLVFIASIFSFYHGAVVPGITAWLLLYLIYRNKCLDIYFRTEFAINFGARQELHILKAKRMAYLLVSDDSDDSDDKSFLDSYRNSTSFSSQNIKGLTLYFTSTDEMDDFISKYSDITPNVHVFYKHPLVTLLDIHCL